MSTLELNHFPTPGRRHGSAVAGGVLRDPPARQHRRRSRRDEALREVLVLDPPATPLRGDESVVVCLPTYNERENIEAMLHALNDALGPSAHVLVIDDDSPDGTATIAERVAAHSGSVEVMRRPHKNGLGRAYAAGFAHAFALGAELIVQMDCDFSHDPIDVLRLVSASRNAELVLGSRYVSGGCVVNWPAHRLLLSRAGSCYARTLLGLAVRDLTGGFKCWRRSALEAVGLHAMRTSGYGFQIETTYRAALHGCQIAEIPITFTERSAGHSKMSASIALEAMREVPKLRRRR